MFEWNLLRYGDVGGSYMSEDSEVEEEEELFPGKLDPHSVGCWKWNCDGESRGWTAIEVGLK